MSPVIAPQGAAGIATAVAESVQYQGRKTARQGSEQRRQLILDAAISDAGERFSWPAFYLGEMAKALIDDVNEALLESRTAP